MSAIGPGAVVDNRYQIERQIGTGGMANVWLADDRLLGRKVAVKVLAPRYAADPGFVERFRREASAAASLSHQNIVAVYDRGEAAGTYYIVMEYLPGPDLKTIIRQNGRLEPRHAVDAALQILAALGAAHKRDVIHRDIKPQNVLVAADGHLKVTDFGIARAGDDAEMTDAGSVIGTAQYLSPEQARGADVTTASDCYAVGVVLYEMLTGRVPFDGDKPVAIAMRQVNEPPVAPRLLVPSIPPELDAAVMKALEKRPGSRFRTAEEFTQALLALRPGLPVPEQPTQVMPPVEQPTQVLATRPPDDTGVTAVASRPATTTARPAPPPPPKRRRWPMIVAIVVASLAAVALALAVFTDIGRGSGVTVPAVEGLSQAAATAELQSAGLRVTPTSRSHPSIAAGNAIGTEPPAGETLDRGATVTLLVSSGPEQVTVPDVVGQPSDDATRAIRAAGFTPRVVQEFSEVAVGDVIDQTPAGETQAPRGSVVEIVVSKGQELVRVPSLSLKSEDDAVAALEAAGLSVGRVTTRETSQREPGLVLDQTPRAGTSVPKGSAVDLVVSIAPTTTTSAPQTVTMPNVVGNTAEDARAKLRGLGFLDPITETQASTEPAGTVIAQEPAAGRVVDPNDQGVVLTVSDGSLAPGGNTGTTP